jgi:mannose/fructose/N-acetylgalactosamine-specific phosphotransferase system component IIB
METKEIAAIAISKLNSRITNEVFLIIQEDRDLMYAYLKAVETSGLNAVNMQIGKSIKQAFSLVNLTEREKSPSCTLIQSHTKFE